MFSHPVITYFCRRCKKEIAHGQEEACWFCGDPLCPDCWETYGHCGHTKADEINARMNAPRPPGEEQPKR